MACVRFVQKLKALSPMFVIVEGILTVVSVGFFLNAELPMLVTGRLPMVSGMVTSPPEPLYPVIVIVPLFVV